MSSNTESFYKDLPSFEAHREISNLKNFVPVPENWDLFITDVKGSTKAIEEGRYKDVNVVGASCVVAATNALGDLKFPFVFGGDGVTFLVPSSKRFDVTRALQYAQKISGSQFGLELRIACVPMTLLYEKGKKVLVAKKKLTGNNYIAMFAGGGLAFAESLMKSSEEYALKMDNESLGSFSGLHCQWNPIKSRKGRILTVIVQAQERNLNAPDIFKEILQAVERICPNSDPVSFDSLEYAWPPKDVKAEAKLTGTKGIFYFLNWLWVHAFAWIMIRFFQIFKNSKNSKAYGYLRSMATNTDHIKFDDALRMVLDVDTDQYLQLLALLDHYYRDGQIYYGTHSTNEALMTCFFQNWDEHIHFIDGAGGGYALAAKMLKGQKKSK